MPLAPGKSVSSGGVTLTLDPSAKVVVNSLDYETEEQRGFRAAALTGAALTQLGQDFVVAFGLSPLETRICPSPALSLENAAGLAAGTGTGKAGEGEEGEARTELATIAYFHRLTTQMLLALGEVADGDEESSLEGAPPGEDEEEDVLLPPGGLEGEGDDKAVAVSSRVVENMGLDVWNAADAQFVRELARVYFGRRAHVEGKGVEVCGVRIC